MTPTDPLRKYVDAGIALTQLTRARAEAVVKELVKAGEVQREQAQDRVEELLDRSRKSTEGLVGLIRKEVAQQLSSMGFATKDDLKKLEARLEGRLAAMAPTPKPKAAGAAGKAGKAGKAPVGKASASRPSEATTPPPGTAARTTGAPKVARRRSGAGPDAPPAKA